MQSSMHESLGFLNEIYQEIRPSNVASQMDRLTEHLRDIRGQSNIDEWRHFATMCLRHPLREVVHACPFHCRAFEKPRGYPGDAEMLDFLYGYSGVGNDVAPATREVFAWIFQCSGSHSARARRQIIADYIDEIAADSSRPRVLAIGAGHLREADLSRAVAAGVLGDVVAFDRDRASLALVDRDYGPKGVRTLQGRVQSLFDGTFDLSTFDLVYAAGLYDYLPWWPAKQLTTALFGMLNPGGRLLIANVTPAFAQAGYVEAYLDWWMIYRSEQQLAEVAEGIADHETKHRRTFQDGERNIAFLEVIKA
jgi:extracellular factor (EF) 3-hydroxypalmitic acid methyl ester biosynthesis protein